jgi:hypothetical protein
LASRVFTPAFYLQNVLFSKRLKSISLEGHPPVFIIGLWRSGTTHLHYLMARDPHFGTLNNHQAFAFNLCLLSRNKLNALLNIFVPGRRPQDNVRLSLDEPAEEEQPFSTMTTRSSIHSFYFPQNQSYLRRYHLFEDILPGEKEAWARDYLYLLKHIAFYNRKQDLLLKNPHNTGRVKELLELFPDAKFIFLHRDPYTMFQSTQRLYHRMINSQFLQFASSGEIDDIILRNNAMIMKKYLKERGMIPSGHLAEVSFEALEKAPIDTLRRIYQELDLQGFENAEPAMQGYLESVKHYKKNIYGELSRELRERIDSEWGAWTAAFGYKGGDG